MDLAIGNIVKDERVQDLLCCALEGGSNYWYEIKRYVYPRGFTQQTLPINHRHLELPFKGGAVIIVDAEQPKAKEYRLDWAAMRRGLQILAEKYPKHWADFLAENEDATTGDVFLQLALFGDVIFG